MPYLAIDPINYVIVLKCPGGGSDFKISRRPTRIERLKVKVSAWIHSGRQACDGSEKPVQGYGLAGESRTIAQGSGV
jgi:hypothetical protein